MQTANVLFVKRCSVTDVERGVRLLSPRSWIPGHISGVKKRLIVPLLDACRLFWNFWNVYINFSSTSRSGLGYMRT